VKSPVISIYPENTATRNVLFARRPFELTPIQAARGGILIAVQDNVNAIDNAGHPVLFPRHKRLQISVKVQPLSTFCRAVNYVVAGAERTVFHVQKDTTRSSQVSFCKTTVEKSPLHQQPTAFSN
jgi:hypothetical protein